MNLSKFQQRINYMWYEIDLNDFYCRLVDFVKLIARTNIKQIVDKRMKPRIDNQLMQLSFGYRSDMSEFINAEEKIKDLYCCAGKIPERWYLTDKLLKIYILEAPGKMVIDINKQFITSFIKKVNIYMWVSSHKTIYHYSKLIDADVGQNTVAYSTSNNVNFIAFYYEQIIKIISAIKSTLERINENR